MALTRHPPQQSVIPDETARQRVRITYEKGEAIKFISHQDESRLWERTLRRANLPLLYKRGFNPQPHIQFAAPLGLGMTGVRELLDVAFSPPVPLDELTMRIREKLPPGVRLLNATEVPFKTVSPQSLTIGADYTIIIYADEGEVSESELQTKIEAFLDLKEVWRERERHGQRYSYNMRPLVLELRYTGFDDYARTLRRERIYFADSEEDQAVFAPYPVILQDEISPERPKPRRKGRKRRRRSGAQPKAEKQNNQAFAEKAADEFD